jgi:hypothetical protein
MSLKRSTLESMLSQYRSELASHAARERWRRYGKKERARYGRAIRRGKRAPKLVPKKGYRDRENSGSGGP